VFAISFSKSDIRRPVDLLTAYLDAYQMENVDEALQRKASLMEWLKEPL